ncbi:MAG: HupE/UreJ family protein [Verrucomicrobiaceae bacterium]|nr:HupE/UreJ family protein [Verrucomicrobiaceae bacterium]
MIRPLLAVMAVIGAATTAVAHPIPELPVRSSFEEGGKATIKVEIDPRIWQEVPDKAPYLFNKDFKIMPEPERAALVEKAKAYTKDVLSFYFLPLGQVTPEFQWQITGEAEVALVKDEDPVVVTGTWQTTVPNGIAGYRIRAAEICKVGVYFLNTLKGKELERMAVLFPGELSFVVDLTGLTGAAVAVEGAVNENSTGGWWATFANFIHEGFVHVVPEGLDHILFVLGLFLLSRAWKPLLWQVSMFTLAHTITLWLASEGYVNVPGSIVEPIIAGSIAFVAIENIFHSRYSHWRLLVVFVFGLIHGLGFAGAFSDLKTTGGSALMALLGRNLGVEFGQLAVISAAAALTFWIKDEKQYRRWVVIPVSLVIAVLGIYWMVERIIGVE